MTSPIITNIRGNLRALALMASGLILIFAGFLFRSVLPQAGFWLSLLMANWLFLYPALFGMFFISIQVVLNARWTDPLLPYAYRLSAFLPVSAIIFITIFPGANKLFIGTGGGETWHHLFRFLIALVFYSVWLLFYYKFGWVLKKGNPRQLKRIAVIFIPVFILTFSVFSWVWFMELIPGFYSTMFSFYHLASLFYAGFAFLIITLMKMQVNENPLITQTGLSNYSGRYLLAVSIIWAYCWYCQFVIVGYAGIPSELAIFSQNPVSSIFRIILLFFGFLLPLLLLIQKKAREKPKMLLYLSIGVLVAVYLDLFNYSTAQLVGNHFPGLYDVGFLLLFLGLFLISFKYTE
jgi:hypothetical protein